MKEITMNTSRCGANGWHEDGTKTFRRISRWITVKTNYHPAKNNCLWEYVKGVLHYGKQKNHFDT